MKKKQWYVCAELNKNCLYIEYFDTKAEAEKVKNNIDKINKFYFAYVEFVWKSELHKSFKYLHGSMTIKIDNIMSLIQSAA